MGEEIKTFDQLRCRHDEAYLYINQAMTQDKPGKGLTLRMYEKGIGLLDLALCTETEQCEKANQMKHNMLRTRNFVESRIAALTKKAASAEIHQSLELSSQNQAGLSENLPLVDDLAREPEIHREPSTDIQKNCNESNEDVDDNNIDMSNVSDTGGSLEKEKVIFWMEGVQLFNISPSGEVTTETTPEILSLVKFDNENTENKNEPTGIIQVGDWTYPLIGGKRSIIKSTEGNYLLSDLGSDINTEAVCLILPDHVTDTEREIFETLIEQIITTAAKNDIVETTVTPVHKEVQAKQTGYQQFSENFASGLIKGAEVVGREIVNGAIKTGEYLSNGTESVTPEYNAKEVDPSKLRQGLQCARWVTTGACQASGWMVDMIGGATIALGKLAAPHMEKGAIKALASLTKQSDTEASKQIAIAEEVAIGTVAAATTVYAAVENSTKILAENISNNAVRIVSHNFGEGVGAITEAALGTVGDSYMAIYNTAAIAQEIARRAVKETIKTEECKVETEVEIEEHFDIKHDLIENDQLKFQQFEMTNFD